MCHSKYLISKLSLGQVRNECLLSRESMLLVHNRGKHIQTGGECIGEIFTEEIAFDRHFEERAGF